MASDRELRSLLNNCVGGIDDCLPSDRDVLVNHDAGHGQLNEISMGLIGIIYIALPLQRWLDNVQKFSTDAEPWMVPGFRRQTREIMDLLKDNQPSWDERSAKLVISHKTGADHVRAGEHDAAEAAFSKAQEEGMCLLKDFQGASVPGALHTDTLTGCIDLILDRFSNAWKLHQPALASNCLAQAAAILKQATLPFKQRLHMRRQDVLSGVKRRNEHQSSKIDAEGLQDYTHQLVTEYLEQGKDDTGLTTSQEEATSLQAQVLRLLSQAYLLSGQAGHALTCVQSVRKLQDSPDDNPGLCLTAIEALILLDGLQEVDAELMALVLHKDAPAALCLEALSAVIQGPRCTALKPAADIVLQRFAEDARVPLSMVQALLGASEKEKTSQEKEALVLDIARNEKVLQLFRKANDSARGQRNGMCALLWHHAHQRFGSKDYKACEDFCTAALGYAEADAEAAVKRQLEQAKLAQVDPDRSQRNLDTTASPMRIPASLPEYVVVQMVKEAGRVLYRVHPLLKNDDPFMDIERVVMPEVERVSHPLALYIIWRALWQEAFAVQGPSKRPGDDAKLAICLAKSITVLEKYINRLAATADDRDSNTRWVYEELEQLFKQAGTRLEAVGRDSFFGPGPVAPSEFAQSAWDIGMSAKTAANNPAAAAAILRACGSFCEAIPCTRLDQWTLMRDAYIMSAQCMLEECAQHPERKSHCLNQIQILHNKTSAALEAAMQLQIDPDDLRLARRCLFSMEFNLAEEQNESSRIVPALERAKAQGLFTAEEYLHFSIMCLDNPPVPHTPSATAALCAALHVMRSQKKWPQMWQLTQTVEELYSLSSDEEKVALLADLGAFVRSVKGPSYPSDQMSWLINTTWTQGRKHAQEQRNAQALPLMAAAINLMDLSDDFSDGKEMFQVEMEKVQREALARPDPPQDASSNTQASDSNVQRRRPRRGLKASMAYFKNP